MFWSIVHAAAPRPAARRDFKRSAPRRKSSFDAVPYRIPAGRRRRTRTPDRGTPGFDGGPPGHRNCQAVNSAIALRATEQEFEYLPVNPATLGQTRSTSGMDRASPCRRCDEPLVLPKYQALTASSRRGSSPACAGLAGGRRARHPLLSSTRPRTWRSEPRGRPTASACRWWRPRPRDRSTDVGQGRSSRAGRGRGRSAEPTSEWNGEELVARRHVFTTTISRRPPAKAGAPCSAVPLKAQGRSRLGPAAPTGSGLHLACPHRWRRGPVKQLNEGSGPSKYLIRQERNALARRGRRLYLSPPVRRRAGAGPQDQW